VFRYKTAPQEPQHGIPRATHRRPTASIPPSDAIPAFGRHSLSNASQAYGLLTPERGNRGLRQAFPEQRIAGLRPAYAERRNTGLRPAFPEQRIAGLRPAYPERRNPGLRPEFPEQRIAGLRPAYPERRNPGLAAAARPVPQRPVAARPVPDRPCRVTATSVPLPAPLAPADAHYRFGRTSQCRVEV
jgi:hypothetical protein